MQIKRFSKDLCGPWGFLRIYKFTALPILPEGDRYMVFTIVLTTGKISK